MSKIIPSTGSRIKPTSVYVTRMSTVYTTVVQPTPVYISLSPGGQATRLPEGSGGWDGSNSVTHPAPWPPSRHSQPNLSSESSRTHTLSGTGIDFPVDNLDTNLTTSNGYYAMPRPEYLIRTVIKNGTDLLRRSVNLQAFKHDMEERLTRTYRAAYEAKAGSRVRRAVLHRVIREASDVKVRIHNIRSGRPEPEIEILYAVYQDEKDPVLAVEAVQVVDENVDQDQAVLLLGHALKIKAEPYLKSSSTGGWDSSSDWLIVSVCLSVFLALLLLWVLFYKLYWGRDEKKEMLVSSVTTSRQASPSAPPRKVANSPFGEDGGFTLERPRSQTNLVTTNTNEGKLKRCPSDRS